jgi:fumarate hydratase subunit beta
MKKIKLPLTDEIIKGLKHQDEILLSGIVYTLRDQAHKKLIELLRARKRPPIVVKGATIYYCGPTRRRPKAVIGSCGPTTSSRMDVFTVELLKAGLKGMIGKGNRSRDVIDALRRYKGIYFITIGGAGAYLAKKVKMAKVMAFKDLGPEAIYKLEIKDFPVIVWNK